MQHVQEVEKSLIMIFHILTYRMSLLPRLDVAEEAHDSRAHSQNEVNRRPFT